MDLGKKSATEIERSLEIPRQVVGVELQGLEFPSDLQVSGDPEPVKKCRNVCLPTVLYNSWWFQGFLLFLTLKLEKNDPFCGGVESTMQRFPKDVKCRSTFETGSNLAKDFKDTFGFLIRSSQHVSSCLSTRQQKWILDDLG